jgi:hypothetical protein
MRIRKSKPDGEIILTGKIDRFNYDVPSSSWKIFWINGDDWKSGWCKGNISSAIKAGDRVKLTGCWRLDERYPSFGLQFFFSSYIKLDESEIDSNVLPQQKIEGNISRIKDRSGNARIFIFKTTNGDTIDCYGRVIPGAEIISDDRLMLYGYFKEDAEQHGHEKKFCYTNYIIIKNHHVRSPRKEQGRAKDHKSLVSLTSSLNKIQSFLMAIGQEQVEYEFHSPFVKSSISRHVRKQLLDRILHSSAENKDLYFLTAFLDRNAMDSEVQKFRNKHPNFKNLLIQCWIESYGELEIATTNIKCTIENYGTDCCNSPTFKELYKEAPGPYKLNQILICLKIINELYERNPDKTIAKICSDLNDEKALRRYLLNIYGVGHKIANWSLTNVTGHWFVIDQHIEKVIKRKLGDTVHGINISNEKADEIFNNWFGTYNTDYKEYSNISHELFKYIFPDYISRKDYNCLPFIVTQYLWYYGKYLLDH